MSLESDLEQLQKDIVARDSHQVAVESREEKAMKGFRVPRPLPLRFKAQIARLPADHPLRTGAVKPYFDVMSGTWKADLPAPAQAPKSEGGHFTPAMFGNTARRYGGRR
jgi:hypothetical protein